MKLLSSLRTFMESLFRRHRVELEMDEELLSHIQHRADDLQGAGTSRAEAERQARIEFGGYEHYKEECRESVGVHFIETVLQDLRFGARVLRKSPGFTTIAVLTLALGIGANTAIFSLINTVMLRLLPVQKPQELIEVLRLNASDNQPTSGFTYELWDQLRRQQDIFSSTFAWSTGTFDLAQGGAVRYANGVFTSGSYFPTLGIKPAVGRLFAAADDQRGCPALAVLSYGFWQEHYGGSRTALGSTISLRQQPFEVIGVSAPGFNGMEVGSRFDVTIPICASRVFDGKQSRLDVRDWWWLRIAGRLKPGIPPDHVDARLRVLSPNVWGAAIPQDWPPEWREKFRTRIFVSAPAATGISELREQFQRPLAVLMAVVGLVLLIASANLASLMLARAASRSKELAVRKALGASRGRLVRQLLVESLLLSFAGGMLGMLFARWGAALLVRYISTHDSNVFVDLSLDLRVLGFTAGIAVFTAILFGVLPALRSSRVSVIAAMKDRSSDARDGLSLRLRSGKWIVAAQVAFSLVLLVVSGLFLRTLRKLTVLDLGFDRSNVLVVNANSRPANIPAAERVAIFDDIESRLRALPGVVSVGRSTRTPITNGETSGPLLVDRPNAPRGPDAVVWMNFISPGYFETLRTPMLAGRPFDASDSATSEKVVIVNEAFARKFLPGEKVIGQYVKRDEGKDGVPPTVLRIVGIVRDAKYESVREVALPQAFFPITQTGPNFDDYQAQDFELRTSLRPSTVAAQVQSLVGQLNKSISLDFTSLAEQVDDSLVQERLLATLSAFFGALALLLAMIGLYGAVSYGVNQRRGEFGVRIALGAAPISILRLVMRDVSVMLAGGSLGGIIMSLFAVRAVQKFLFGLTPQDPATFAGAVVLLSAVAVLAAYLPARRAMNVDPMAALRYE
ncbi:MAG TPA: ABC transporter permease [Candidatus Limnocylindrales bacterium]|nr:ABC transporter permease [Candidatus Limnocylindrales bacterium]